MNRLELKVLLAGVDRLTKPLLGARRQTQQLGVALKAARTRVKELDNQRLDVEQYRQFGRQLGDNSRQLAEARNRAALLAQSLRETAAPSKKMQKEFELARLTVQTLLREEQNLMRNQQRLRQTMQAGGLDVRHLAAEQRRLKTELLAANTAVDTQRTKLEQLNATQKRLRTARQSYRQTRELQGKLAGSGTGALATAATVSSPVIGAVRQYSAFEDAMKGVARQVNGARDANGQLTATYYEIAEAIKAISERLPSENGALDIAALVEGAARMGIQGQDNLLAFAETAAKASKAFELPAEELADNLGKIANLYKIPIQNIEQLGDTINYLDDNAQSKGADIIEVLQRMGGVADKLDYRKASALGSTFLSLGANAETAATASIAMVRELSIATMQGQRFQDGMATLKLSPAQMEQRMSHDAMGTLITVLGQVSTLPKDRQMRVTTQLFGKEYGKDAAKLANNLSELHKQLNLVNDAKARGSMQRESEIDADSLSAQWLLLKTGIGNAFASLGVTLRPQLMDILGTLKHITGATRRWIETHPQLAGALLKAMAAVAAVTAALGGLALAVAAILGPLALNKMIFSTLGIRVLPLLGAAIRSVGGVLVWLGRLALANPIGLLVTALGLAAIAIWQNWDWLKAQFTTFFDWLKAKVQWVKDLVQDLYASLPETFKTTVEVPDNMKPGTTLPWQQTPFATGPGMPGMPVPAALKPLQPARTTTVQAPVHAPITIVTQPGQDKTAIAGEVQRQLQVAQRQQRSRQRNTLQDRD